jgi:hypothetical protein
MKTIKFKVIKHINYVTNETFFTIKIKRFFLFTDFVEVIEQQNQIDFLTKKFLSTKDAIEFFCFHYNFIYRGQIQLIEYPGKIIYII